MQPVHYQQQQQQPIDGVLKRRTCILLIFGILHMIWALVILIMGGIIVGEFVMSEINKHSTAIWSSIIFAITGILSTIIYCLPRNKALIITHNVFAILSIFFAFGVVVAGAVGAEHYDCEKKSYYNYPRNRNYLIWTPYECRKKSDRHMAQPIYICLIVFGVLEMVGGIISTFYSFRLYNCCTQGSGNCCKDCCDGCCEDCKQKGYQGHSQAYQMQHAPSYQQQIPQQQQIPRQAQQPMILTDGNGQQYYLMPIQPAQPMPSIQPIRSIQPIQPNQPIQPQVTLATTSPEATMQNPPPYTVS